MPRRTLVGFFLVALLGVVMVGLWWAWPRATVPSGVAAAPEHLPAPPLQPGSTDDDVQNQLGGDFVEVWPDVNLAEVRRALPDNVYWELDFPTEDPAQLTERREAKKARNNLFGKIQSGTASLEEIEAYYDERRRISADYVAFSDYLLTNYGDRIDERDVGLLELAREMNLKRLDSLPVERDRALARKEQQDRARAAWNQP